MSITIEELWEKKSFIPNESQRNAILHINSPLFLTAGPGSGKTRVLLWRTLNLIVFHGIKPEEIFLSTFTEKASHQLKEGLLSLLGFVTNITAKPYDISKMSVGTVHSLCQKLLLDRRFSQGVRTIAPVVMDELSQYFYLYNNKFWDKLWQIGGYENTQEAIESLNTYFEATQGKGSRHIAVTNCISFFNRLSEETIEPNKFTNLDSVELNSLMKMYEYYLTSLKKNGVFQKVDFSLLQQSAYDFFKNSDVSSRVFKHVIIDEYQDTNVIQEKIFFELAKGHKNICVVGDDDQALYRFRGASVENLVEFESRCQKYFGIKAKRIDLDINYRSRKEIVSTYTKFIELENWEKANFIPKNNILSFPENPSGLKVAYEKQSNFDLDDSGQSRITSEVNNTTNKYYRFMDKKIKAHSIDTQTSVLTTEMKKPDDVFADIAKFVKKLKEEEKVQDYNQIAFLFPAMKNNSKVLGLKRALEEEGIEVYAPRAGRFLEIDEAKAVFGLFLKILGRPVFSDEVQEKESLPQENQNFRHISAEMMEYKKWVDSCITFSNRLCEEDKELDLYIKDRKSEVKILINDFSLLVELMKKKNWTQDIIFKKEMKKDILEIVGLSEKSKKNLSGKYFDNIVDAREKDKNPFTLGYIFSRMTSVDWSILDLFYQLNGFKHFREMYKLAEDGTDEAPVCNLGLITQYLSRFMDEYGNVITAFYLSERRFINRFFLSYTYALFRRGESEYEDNDDPFPKGRVPFLTIHQSKGLEFPVVILGSIFKKVRLASVTEKVVRELKPSDDAEPLDKIGNFDTMRMFYVGLSRAKNLLVLPQYKGSSNSNHQFKTLFETESYQKINDFDFSTLPNADFEENDISRNYSYTSDYLNYQKCPRNYMIFRRYDFVPSRSQTMFFGSLVHQTIEDLHNYLINKRNDSGKGRMTDEKIEIVGKKNV